MSKMIALGHLKESMGSAKAFFQNLVAEIAQATAEAIEEVARMKANKTEAVSVIIPVSGWESNDGMEGYPNYYDIEAPGVTGKDRAEITLAPGSLSVAGSCGLCLTNQTLEGKIRIWAASVPSGELIAEYWVESGKE